MKFNSIPKERCMETKMNKKGFIDALSKRLSYSIEECFTINEILESNFFISKKSRDKIIEEFIKALDVDRKEATRIYNEAIKIINGELKNKLKHPFKSKD